MAENAEIRRAMRCAVYTRKSTEEGLDQEFNSLQAQREERSSSPPTKTQSGSFTPSFFRDTRMRAACGYHGEVREHVASGEQINYAHQRIVC